MAKKTIAGLIIGSAVFFSFGISVLPASALTIDEVQSQIQSLLQQISSLTNILNSLKGQTNASIQSSVNSAISIAPSQHRICNVLARNLAQGTQGDDVMSLQEFLKAEGYLSANATGYFGPMTAQAVAKWQAKEGVSAVGHFGPMSRERIKIWCGGGGWGNQERFSASPARGSAPLTVVFDTWLSGFRVQSIYYTIDFGDGTSERAADCYAPADACLSPGQNKHTYSQNGTYTATLNKISDPCQGNPACMAPISSEVVAKQQIHVGQTACTKEYVPMCGSKQIYCITTPCNPIQQTYSNRCMMEADGASFLHDGQCRSDWEDPANDPRCKAWYDGCNSCSRSAPGQPAMCTLRACMSDMMAKPYCTAYFDGTTNKPPTISGFSGPTTLRVNEAGTWTINASDPENGQLSYQVWWGDEGYAPMANMASYAREFTQTTTFTHAYVNSGTYTVSIIVRDSSGQEAKTSATVNVNTDVACIAIYDPVCGRPTGCANTCPPGQYCTMICQLKRPETYSNRCALNAAGAEFLYNGNCASTTY
ncbi:peptidoglycan-binding protein [Candidatus Kaiserbacteria bacterium]|nr:peptidoglycan-binding protein [Candidatus Kaiserbacteria bacterium]